MFEPRASHACRAWLAYVVMPAYHCMSPVGLFCCDCDCVPSRLDESPHYISSCAHHVRFAKCLQTRTPAYRRLFTLHAWSPPTQLDARPALAPTPNWPHNLHVCLCVFFCDILVGVVFVVFVVLVADISFPRAWRFLAPRLLCGVRGAIARACTACGQFYST